MGQHIAGSAETIDEPDPWKGKEVLEAGVTVRLGDDGACVITHDRSGATVVASTYRHWGARRSPSDADLMAAALGASILASIEELIERAEIDRADIALKVTIRPRPKPTRVSEMLVAMHIPRPPSEMLRLNLLRAAETCIARRAIDPRVKVLVSIVPAEP